MAPKWILRKGTKASGFRYSRPDGRPIRGKDTLGRIDALRIPPAWRDVHVAANPRAPIQVWGLDARGRKQYRYHARAVEKGERRKHYRVRQMAKELPAIRKKLLKDFRRRGFPEEKICAGIVLLISEAFMRTGSDRYERENNTFGITTIRKSHVSFENDRLFFDYVAKRSIQRRQFIVSERMIRFVESLMATPGPRLFRYQYDGGWMDVDSREVNEYLQRVAKFPYTAKDLRTWGGTLRAATWLADQPPARSPSARKKNVLMAVRSVASELGNTPAICRKSYVHPAVLARYLKNGAIIEVPDGRARRRAEWENTAEEEALIDFLDRHFPERRTDPRGRALSEAESAA